MAHFPKPFFRDSRQLWYVQLDGRQVNLGRDKDSAFRTYHSLMANRTEPSPTPPPNSTGLASTAPTPLLTDAVGITVVEILDQFLTWVQANRSPHTYRWYKDRINSFCNAIANGLTADQLKPFHVQQWVDAYGTDLASGTKRNLIASVKRGMGWAEEQGYIDHSPIARMRKPGCGRKEQVVTTEQYQALLGWCSDQDFKDLLTVSWETGCRPQESLRVEARHFDVAGGRWAFPVSESKGKQKLRVVYLTPKALEVCVRLAALRPTGTLFRNENGRAWKTMAVNCRFCRAQKTVGVKVSLYAFRHTWITRMLIKGVDAVTVATLAGHSDPSTLAKIYAHLTTAPGYLSEQVRRAG